MLKIPIYLDFNATAPLSQKVITSMPQLLQLWGNPSSIHLASRGPKTILRETKKKLADYLKVSALEIIFNSGASEGNNTVLKSVWNTYRPGNHFGQPVKNEFLISAVEHPSIAKTAQFLETEGAIVRWIPVSRDGVLDLNFIKENLNERTALVSVMFANNETGTVFPIKEIVALAKAKSVLVHSDCVQAFGKTDFNLQDLGVDYATISAHKFYALKGCGVLFVRKNSPFINLIHGGGQERSRRGGTENILGIASLGVMVEELSLVTSKETEIKNLRDHFENEIKKQLTGVSVTCEKSVRLANTSSLIINGVDGETLLVSLDLKGFAVSTGAACSSGNPEPSPVLLAVGLSRQEAQNSLRVSLGWTTTKSDIDLFTHQLVEVVEHLRSINEAQANV
ncbi:MAG: cysteine desulfurase family protein [Bdellovibrionota bacterium]